MDFSLSQEQQALVELASDLARRYSAGTPVTWDEAGEFPWDFAKALSAHGLTGIALPIEIGGQGASLLDSILVMEAIGRTAPHLADAVQATNFGAVRQIAAFGSARVIEEVYAKIASGEALATVAMSEPDAGSALSSLSTTAKIDGDSVIVQGAKTFNSNGPHATHYAVWARFSDDRRGIGVVVVPADTEGFRRGKPERFLSGEHFCELYFDNCRVPRDYVLLEHDGIRQMMQIFNIERLGNATRSYSFGEHALGLAINYMTERRTGGKLLSSYQGLRWKVADLRMRLDSARLLLYRAASELVDGAPSAMNTSIAKCVANEAGFAATNEVLQIFGGYGYSSESALDYIFKRTRGWMIAGGSVEIQRNRIAYEIFGREAE